MVKSELIKKVSDKLADLSDRDVELGVNQIFNSIIAAVSSGERVEIRGFGSFKAKFHEAREAHNPKTGEKVITEPKHVAHFKPGKEMKDRVNATRGVPIVRNTAD